jgi:hypothetical protein
MSEYFYSIQTAFADIPPDLTELSSRITLAFPQNTLVSVEFQELLVRVVLETELSPAEKLRLDSICQTPTPLTLTLDYGGTVAKTLIGGVPICYLGTQSNEIYISKENQRHYSSIKAALEAHPQPNTIFVVYPGVYVEQNPLILNQGCLLKAACTAQNTIIVAANPNADLIQLGRMTCITCVTLMGAYGTGSRGVYFDASRSGGIGEFAAIFQCFIIDCNIGAEVDNKNALTMSDTLYCDKVLIRCVNHACAKGVYAHAGGFFVSTSSQVLGRPGKLFSHGLSCVDPGSKISMTTSSIWFSGVAMYLDNSAIFELVLFVCSYCGVGLQVGPNGSQSSFTGSNVYIRYTQMYDVCIEAASPLTTVDLRYGQLDSEKIHNPYHLKLNLTYTASKYGKNFQSTLGDCQFGSVAEPSKVSLGQGQYIVDGVVMFANDTSESGVWFDNSIGANTFDNPPVDLFQSPTTGQCVYIGSNYISGGMKLSLITPCASTPIEAFAYEYWNGSEWMALKVLQTYASPPYRTLSTRSVFSEADENFHLRFNITSTTPFADKTLNGATKKWIRIRLTQDISLVPVIQYIKLHTSSTIVNNDGFIEYTGDARVVKNLTLTPLASPSQTVSLTPKLSKHAQCFPPALQTRIALDTVTLASNTDTSFPLKIILSVAGTTSSVEPVTFTLYYGRSMDGSSLSTTDSTESLTQQCVLAGENKEKRVEFVVDLNRMNFLPQDPSEQSLLWLSLERPATDLYTGDVLLFATSGRVVTWNTGSHLESF